MKAKTVLAAALAATFGYGASAHAYVIDLFDDPAPDAFQRVRDNNPLAGGVFDEYDGGPTIIGGSRELFIDATTGAAIGPEIGASLIVFDGVLRYSNDAGVTSTGIVTWDGDDDSQDLSYDLGANFVIQDGCPATGCNSIVADVLSADVGFEFKIGVYTDATNYSILTAFSQGIPPQPNLAVFPFEWWSLPAGNNQVGDFPFIIEKQGNVDFTDVGAFQLTLISVNANNTPIEVDLRIDSITKIPEPGTLALLGIGILAGGAAGRRRLDRKA
jgi:hypothetical protein